MTCREKLAIEHPEKANTMSIGGCNGCPHNVGYLDKPSYCPLINGRWDNLSITEKENRCGKCWDREIPELEKVPETIEQTEQKPRISNMLDLLWFVEKVMANVDKMVSIDMSSDNMFVNVYPYKEEEDK